MVSNKGYLSNKRLAIFMTNLSAFWGVENIGLEPMTSCMPCKRSSQLS